jgi:hypothetical protein
MAESNVVPIDRADRGRGRSSAEELRRQCWRLWSELDSIWRQKWLPTISEIIQYIQPNRGEFTEQDVNRGDRRDDAIVNNVASDSLDRLIAAIDMVMTSEAREWHTYSPEDPLDAENDGVREYCHTAQSIMFALIAKSGFYAANRNLIADVAGPGFGLMLIESDPDTVFRFEHVPIGSYRLAADARGRVNKVVRQYTLTAEQMVEEFGDAVSLSVKNAMGAAVKEQKMSQTPFRVLHVIEQRSVREYGKLDSRNKPWASTWVEIGAGTWGSMMPGAQNLDAGPLGDSGGILRESGYDEQPFIAPRWNSLGKDAYGKDSPGWKVLGDVKGLQAWEIGGAKALALILDPPMNRPADLADASLMPGAMNPLSGNSNAKFEPSFKIDPQTIAVAAEVRREFEQRIDRGCYGDVLFLLSRDQSAQKDTAEAIRGKKEERLLQLGGVGARYADEGLKPGISRMFVMAQRAGKFPPPPQQLLRRGKIKIDFQNPLVTAQKTIHFTGLQQLISTGIAVAQARAAGADKLDGDEIMDSAADMLGTKPNLLKSDDALNVERQQAAAAKQAAATGTAMTQAAPAIKDLSNADPEKLRSLLSALGPAAVAQGTA